RKGGVHGPEEPVRPFEVALPLAVGGKVRAARLAFDDPDLAARTQRHYVDTQAGRRHKLLDRGETVLEHVAANTARDHLSGHKIDWHGQNMNIQGTFVHIPVAAPRRDRPNRALPGGRPGPILGVAGTAPLVRGPFPVADTHFRGSRLCADRGPHNRRPPGKTRLPGKTSLHGCRGSRPTSSRPQTGSAAARYFR